MVISKMVDHIKFSLFSPEMIRKMSSAKLTVPDTYDDDSYPIDGGLVDPRMGVIDPGLKCRTCGGKIKSCPGHSAHIELVRPVIHPEFAKHILLLLKSTCHNCKRLLMSERGIGELAQAIESEEGEDEGKSREKKVTKCPHCNAINFGVRLLKPTSFYLLVDKSDKAADAKKKERKLEWEQMLPTDVRKWLEEIPNSDLRVLGFDPVYARPEWMVLTALIVPPVSVRPSITLETGDRSEDDLTHKLVDIMRINQRLEQNINAGAPQLIIEDLWELVQYHVTTYFNNETSNIPPARHRSGRPLKTLSQRLKGKEGRFRYNLSGKRVNFSARTVVSPDPNISIDDVGVPMMIAESLTVPVKVTDWNIEQCKKYVEATEYPKSEYVIRPDGKRIQVTEITRPEILESLGKGYVVERQLINGDTVLFNRQPSLHRISIMCHSVKVLPGKTLRLNPAVCAPYNADFDGDEMNLHVIQSEEARVEAEKLMKVHDQIISPRHGRAIIKPGEDHVSGAYFMTRDSAEFTKDEACQILAIAGITKLPKPDRGKNFSGKLLFSLLLPSDLNVHVKRSKLGEEVVIKDGILVKGSIESKAFENEILEQIFHSHGAEAAQKFIDDATRVAVKVVTMQGLSVSLANYSLSPESVKKLREMQSQSIREIDSAVIQYKNKTLERSPGRTLKESLEDRVMMISSKARDSAGSLVEKDLGMENSSIIMAKIGARGSLLNAIQMSAMLGQQAVRAKRVKRGYKGRTLPHFRRGDMGGPAKGYVLGAFRFGLDPRDFFHHSMGGRESLVNTAIRTARSGYMQRRLINALQDLVVNPDMTVRDSRGVIVQYMYGGDGIDPIKTKSKAMVETQPREENDA